MDGCIRPYRPVLWNTDPFFQRRGEKNPSKNKNENENPSVREWVGVRHVFFERLKGWLFFSSKSWFCDEKCLMKIPPGFVFRTAKYILKKNVFSLLCIYRAKIEKEFKILPIYALFRNVWGYWKIWFPIPMQKKLKSLYISTTYEIFFYKH